MANSSYLFEYQEEELMLEPSEAGRWKLAPDLLELIWWQDRKAERDDGLVHRS
jgi:hypothetical protein